MITTRVLAVSLALLIVNSHESPILSALTLAGLVIFVSAIATTTSCPAVTVITVTVTFEQAPTTVVDADSSVPFAVTISSPSTTSPTPYTMH
jgi:hypothetical protein